MSTTADPLAAALRVVLDRRGHNYLQQDELAWARQVRNVAQLCWMALGEPERLRSEDADRAQVCRELVKRGGRGRTLRLVPSTPAPIRDINARTPRSRRRPPE